MPIVSVDFWASASASVSWRTRIAFALASNVSRIREPDSAARSTADGQLAQRHDVRAGTQLVEGVPQRSDGGSGPPATWRRAPRTGARCRRWAATISASSTPAPPASEMPTMSTYTVRAWDHDRRGRQGPGPDVDVGVEPSGGGEQERADQGRQHRHADVEQREDERRHERRGRRTAGRSRACRGRRTPTCGRARRGRRAGARTGRRRAARPGGASAVAHRRRRPAAPAGRPAARRARRPGPAGDGPAARARGRSPTPRQPGRRRGRRPRSSGDHPRRTVAVARPTRSSRSAWAGRERTIIAQIDAPISPRRRPARSGR